ncbi:MAG TPA: MBL fold metallo-hydrolase [Saprospiraceae bacterium]|nr:MBL fold metallo-hydrolase [Saprospiraceae bacterium]
MNIKFCGAAREVTGSAHLITLKNGYKILLDCGLYQGSARHMKDFNTGWLFQPEEVDCVILSHAHIDHSGRLPKLVKDGFKGTIYSTHATRSLCAIMLLDSAKIQERDAEYANKWRKRHGKKANKKPLYKPEHVKKTMDRFSTTGYNQWFSVHPDVDVVFKDAGHILGSASVSLRIREGKKTTTIGFTGDIGRPERPILRDPQPMPKAEYIISESTYGDRLHEEAPGEKEKLFQIIQEACVKKKGKLIIPAFSIGRTQEVVYLLDQLSSAGRLPKIPVFVDSPLAVNATEIFGIHPECYDDDLNEYLLTDKDPFGFHDLHYIRAVEDSKRLNTLKGPAIIISASGMMNAGRVKHHLFNNIDNPKATFLIVGYCADGTPGGELRKGARELYLFGEIKKVRATIEIMDSFSAHGDKNEMLDFLSNQRKSAKQVFLVHGNLPTQKSFAKMLESVGFKSVVIPRLGQTIPLKDPNKGKSKQNR